MKSKSIFVLVGIFFCWFVADILCSNVHVSSNSAQYDVQSRDDVIAIFPKTVEQINDLVEKTKLDVQKRVNAIAAIPNASRTFENTAVAFDMAAFFYLLTPIQILNVLSMASSDDALRDAATKAAVELKRLRIDNFEQNEVIYDAFLAYVNGNANSELLTEEQTYFLEEIQEIFRCCGFGLSADKQEKVKQLKKKLVEVGSTFSRNINEDTSFITVKRDELYGVEEKCIDGLQKADDGSYIVTTDFSTVLPVLKYCKVSATRKRIYAAFRNRAYPVNMEPISEIINLRDELAITLGYESYAALDLESQMAKAPKRVYEFLDELARQVGKKEHQEFELLLKYLPDSVELEEGKLQPWDVAFCKTHCKKLLVDFDEEEVRRYFSTEATLEKLLGLYEKFFGLTLKKTSASKLWADEIEIVEAYRGDQLLGYILLDLYVRKNKYSGGECNITVVPGIDRPDGYKPAVATVMASFPRSTSQKPLLLSLTEVRKIFHEFGHAIHDVLGATSFAKFSGTNTKIDFVEMPSQMLEEWLWEPEILKSLGTHYQTGEPLPADLIKKIVTSKHFFSGHFVLRQAAQALMSLDYFAQGKDKDFIKLTFDARKQLLPHIKICEEIHTPCSWWHVRMYGAKYYSYLWSKVFALDLFDHIKKFGLLNPEIGKQYAEKVIGKGGSKDPNELLKDFLGREPNADAFFADLGLEK